MSGAAFANPVFVALDVAELGVAEDLARRLEGHVGGFKVGLELFSARGPEAVTAIAAHGPVFLDLKLHDIPNTVARACRRLSGLGVDLLTVHASGGPDMVAAAADAFDGRVLAVTVLTSLSDADLGGVGQPGAAAQVRNLAGVAVDAGAPGIVCAARHARDARDIVGTQVLVVTPGIRPAGAGGDDHARAATPEEALAAGADIIVVGRPITAARDPVDAARRIVVSLAGRGRA
ncbi:MAG: orotidine-5'-phosphate decarboxylase [Nitriliruptorales bacterium]